MSSNKFRCFDGLIDDANENGANQVKTDSCGRQDGLKGSFEKTPKRSRAQMAEEDDDVDAFAGMEGTRYIIVVTLPLMMRNM